MLYEIHMLKNYPPVNLNRDESGAPKSCMFGGTTRGRVSSQCLKRSWRRSPLFSQTIGAEHLGIRTRKLPQLVAEKLAESVKSILTLYSPKSVDLATKTAQRIRMAATPHRLCSMLRKISRRWRKLFMKSSRIVHP